MASKDPPSEDDPSDTASEVSFECSRLERFASSFAILGDSTTSLAVSLLFLLASIAFSWWLDGQTPLDPYQKLGPVPVNGPPIIYHVENLTDTLPDAVRQAYLQDGVIAVRGLVDKALLERLDIESAALIQEEQKKERRRKGTQFYTVRNGVLFPQPNGTHPNAFLELALQSRIPRLAATLLQEEMKEQVSTVRVIRDIFLAKDEDPYICGYHVDDMGKSIVGLLLGWLRSPYRLMSVSTGFWPATPESPGINAWIALDDIPKDGGGGFALAVGSHIASWRDEAHYVTGASSNFPPGGYRNATDLVTRRTGAGTCNLKTAAAHLHRRMEETKRVYAIQRGDVIFHTRWLFHRTVAVNHPTESVYRRYSIRYGPGSSVIPPGYGTEPSVLWDERNGGRTADEVARADGPWYPMVYPEVSSEELSLLPQLVQEKMGLAEERRLARQKEMTPLVRRLAKKQLQPAL